MSTFCTALDLQEGTTLGVTGLPQNLDQSRAATSSFSLGLLHQYVDEAFQYLQLAGGKEGGNFHEVSSREEYARVGGVAVEFLVRLKRTDVLFGDVLSKFEAVGQRGEWRNYFLKLLFLFCFSLVGFFGQFLGPFLEKKLLF